MYPFTLSTSLGTRSQRCFNCTSIVANAFSTPFLPRTSRLYMDTTIIRTTTATTAMAIPMYITPPSTGPL